MADAEAGARLDLHSATRKKERRNGKGALPDEINLLSEQNRPKKGQPLTILRFLRILGLWILTCSMIVSFGYSFFIAAGAFLDPDLADLKEILSWCISMVSLGSFLLIGISSEGKGRAAEITRLIEERKRRIIEFGLTEEQAKLVDEEYMPVRTLKGKKAKFFFFGMAIACLGTYGFFYFVMHVQLHLFAMYGLVGAAISVGFILAGFAGEINVELFRFEIKIRGRILHVHEAAIGIFFIIVAVPLLYNGASIDKVLALFYFFVGAWLLGRDWKDMSAGKVVERVKREE
ncbi:MAG: hypothetical protein Q6373_017210 [Candidatus Sigynarchaeota archaeon]